MGLVFVMGLTCGIEGAYLLRAQGAPSYAGVFAAWCDLREIAPYGFGYMLSAKVGTGIVAELGSMRISDEIDALEVMGVQPMIYLAATRLLAAWLVFPFMYLAAIGVMFFASYLAVVEQIAETSAGGYFLIFWMFQNPPDLLFSLIKAMTMATAIVLVGCYYGYNASGRPGRGRHGDGEVDGLEHRLGAPDRDDGDVHLLGPEPTSANRRLRLAHGQAADRTRRFARRAAGVLGRRLRTAARRRDRPLRRLARSMIAVLVGHLWARERREAQGLGG